MQARRWKLISKIGIWFNYKLNLQYGRIACGQPLEQLLPLYTLTPVKGSILKTKALATKLTQIPLMLPPQEPENCLEMSIFSIVFPLPLPSSISIPPVCDLPWFTTTRSMPGSWPKTVKGWRQFWVSNTACVTWVSASLQIVIITTTALFCTVSWL